MQITLNNSEDFRQLLNIVRLIHEEFDDYSHGLQEEIRVLKNQAKSQQQQIGELANDKAALYVELDDCKKEKQTLATLNSALSEEIERIKTQQSCDEAVVIRDNTLDNLQAELKATIEENEQLRKNLAQYWSQS